MLSQVGWVVPVRTEENGVRKERLQLLEPGTLRELKKTDWGRTLHSGGVVGATDRAAGKDTVYLCSVKARVNREWRSGRCSGSCLRPHATCT